MLLVYIFQYFYSISGNTSLNNLWPELCQKDPPKPPEQKEQLTNIGENDGTIVLDNFEYPELDGATVIPKSKHSFTARKHYLPSPILRVLTPTHGIMEPKKMKTVRKFKRTGLISINIYKALQVYMIDFKHKNVFKTMIELIREFTFRTQYQESRSAFAMEQTLVKTIKYQKSRESQQE